MSLAATQSEPLDLEELNAFLLPLSAADRLSWAVNHFGDKMVLLSSMQKTASILIHLFHALKLDNEILFGDTGFHFHETLKLRDNFCYRYHLNIVTLYPEMTPEQQEAKYGKKLHLFVDGQPLCCQLRKEVPFLNYVRENGKTLVVNGLRTAEGEKRKKVQVLMRDPRLGGYTLHPILDWTDEQVAEYIQQHNPPVHPLHAKGYPSIGCACCTTAVAEGENPRAGRWRHLRPEGESGPRYCGINFTDGSGI